MKRITRTEHDSVRDVIGENKQNTNRVMHGRFVSCTEDGESVSYLPKVRNTGECPLGIEAKRRVNAEADVQKVHAEEDKVGERPVRLAGAVASEIP